MSKKKDPVVNVLNYFEQADLVCAQLALSLAREIVKKRTPTKTPAAKSKAPRRQTAISESAPATN